MLVDGASVGSAAALAADVVKKHRIRRNRWKAPVYDIPVAFDTETTNYTYPDDEGNDTDVGWMYIWMFRFGDPLSDKTEFFYGRTSEDLNAFLTSLSDNLGLGKEKHLVIYVHNLGFDIEFIRDLLDIKEELHESTHTPIFVRDSRGIEFRDSKILAGGLSLKKVGESLNNGLEKKSGDLNYDLIRTPQTPLTEEEMGYCQGDVDVLASYIQNQIRLYNGLQHVPLTNTGRVRRFASDSIYAKSNKYARFRYHELMESCVLTFEEYQQCKRAFAGGFTHANIKYVGKLLHDIFSYDLTSSYPTTMLAERFPMGKPEHIDTCTYDELREMVNDPDCCILFDVQFRDLKVRDGTGDCYLTNDAEKCIMENPVAENGRIRECGKYAITITDVDFKIISKCYTWSDIHISNVLKWRADYLPSQIIGVILDLYNSKTTLKGVEGQEEEYQIKKGMLNSMYGMCVTKILRDIVTVASGEWETLPLTEKEMRENIDKNNKSKTRFLYYPWGVWITAYARFNLWTAILTLGDDYVYSDTDSIKVRGSAKAKLDDYLDRYHADLKMKLSWMLEKRRKYSFDDLHPKDIKGKEHPIGIWEYEGHYEYFKTLGSKRYMTYDTEKGILPTVAGIDPKNLRRYLQDNASSVEGMFSMFADGLHVPRSYTGKLAPVYYDGTDLTVTDFMGNEDHVKQAHGVHLKPVDFTLTMTGSFLDLVKMIQGVI